MSSTPKNKQKNLIIRKFNGPLPKRKLGDPIELFKKEALKNPDRNAVVFGNLSIIYSELDEKSDNLEKAVTNSLSENQKIIYVVADSGIDIIISFLSILKSGNILVPVNPILPRETLTSMFKEVRPDLILTQKKYLKLLPSKIRKLIIAEEIASRPARMNGTNYNHTQKENKFSHIYFTSGSTGRPKAVLGKRISLAYNIFSKKNIIKSNTRVSQLYPIYSHMSLSKEILPTLCLGGTLFVPENHKVLLTSSDLSRWIIENKINVIFLVSNLFKYFIGGIERKEELSNLRYLFAAGSTFYKDKYLKKFFELKSSNAELSVGYGAAEATTRIRQKLTTSDLSEKFISFRESPDEKAIVIKEDGEVALPGEIGEIYLRSPYLSAGYCNNREQTDKAFIQNPFSQKSGDIVYKTGDLGTRLTNGRLQLKGRLDGQVKIMGNRVQTEEVERKILQHEDIKDCAVIAKKTPDKEDYLVCYYVSRGPVESHQLIKFLNRKLPAPAIPAFFIRLEKLIFLNNGKLNRVALASLKTPLDKAQKSANLAPEQKEHIKKILLKAWIDVLGEKKITVKDNFFNLGGTSVSVLSINSRIEKELGVILTLSDLFKNPTITGLAEYLVLGKGKDAKIEKTAKKTRYHLSAEQFRIWHGEKGANLNLIHDPLILMVMKGELNLAALRKTLKAIANRHEILKSNFFEIKDKEGKLIPVQAPNIRKKLKISFFDLSRMTAKRRMTEEKRILEEQLAKFNLKNEFPVRFSVIRRSPKEHVLLPIFHSIACDMHSGRLFDRELKAIYEFFTNRLTRLPAPPPIQYKDYSCWQKKRLSEIDANKQKIYWKNKLSGGSPVIKILNERKEKAERPKRSRLFIDLKTGAQIEAFSQQRKLSLYVFFFTLSNLFLHKVTGQKDIIIDSFFTKRDKKGLQNVFGPIFNRIPIRSVLNENETFSNFLDRSQNNIFEAVENSDFYEFNAIENLASHQKDAKESLFNTLFHYNDNELPGHIANLEIQRIFCPSKSPRELILGAGKRSGVFTFSLTYRINLDAHELFTKLHKIMTTILNNPETKIADINFNKLPSTSELRINKDEIK